MIGISLALGRQAPTQWWPEGAVFAADFVGQRYFTGSGPVGASTAYSFSRASSKMGKDALGDYALFAADTPAITTAGLSYEPQVEQFAYAPDCAGGDIGALPSGWYSTATLGDFTLSEVALGQIVSGLQTMLFRVQFDNSGGGGQASAILSFSNSSATNNCLVSQGEVISGQVWLSDTPRVGDSLATGGVDLEYAIRNVGGSNIEAGPLYADAPRDGSFNCISGTHAVSSATASYAQLVIVWDVEAGAVLDTDVLIAMPNLTKTGALYSPIPFRGVREADVITLHLPATPCELELIFDDLSTQVIAGVSGDFVLPTALDRSVITQINAVPS